MKPLAQYIEEARMKVGELPFTRDEFTEFLIAVEDYDEDADIYKEVQHRVESKYGHKAWRGFLGWCEGTQNNSDSDWMYDILSNMPADRISKVLGAGSYGAAVELSNGLVCKIFHKNTPMEPQDRKFFEYCMKHKTDCFPTIKKLGTNFVVMDKLKMETSKCKMYDEYLGFSAKKVINKLTVHDIAKMVIHHDKNAGDLVAQLNKDAKECLDWAVDALTHLKKAVGWDSFSDLRLPNIGERSDGAIIWFDI